MNASSSGSFILMEPLNNELLALFINNFGARRDFKRLLEKSALNQMEGEKLPLRVASGDNEYIRIQYNFCPQSIANSTVSRTLVHDEENPNYGIVEHVLENGETVNFKGNWKTPNDSQKECILVFRDNEVVLLPLSASVLHLKKTT